jgi:hypothetical protein
MPIRVGRQPRTHMPHRLLTRKFTARQIIHDLSTLTGPSTLPPTVSSVFPKSSPAGVFLKEDACVCMIRSRIRNGSWHRILAVTHQLCLLEEQVVVECQKVCLAYP